MRWTWGGTWNCIGKNNFNASRYWIPCCRRAVAEGALTEVSGQVWYLEKFLGWRMKWMEDRCGQPHDCNLDLSRSDLAEIRMVTLHCRPSIVQLYRQVSCLTKWRQNTRPGSYNISETRGSHVKQLTTDLQQFFSWSVYGPNISMPIIAKQ